MERKTSPFKRLINYIKTHRKQTVIGGVVFVAAFSYTAAFFLPQQVVFSYGGDSCVKRFTLLPAIHTVPKNSKFDVSFQDELKIGSQSLLATKLCVRPLSQPAEGKITAAVAPFGSLFARTHLVIEVPKPPQVDRADINTAFPASKPLAIGLTSQDTTFQYALKVATSSASCHSVKAAIECDIPSLKLKQDSKYNLELMRQFKSDTPTAIAKASVRTLKATSITSGSVKKGQTVYAKPTEFSFIADKELVKATAILKQEGGGVAKIPVKTTIVGKKITVAFDKQLAREQKFTLTLSEVEAKDGSTIVEPHKVPFTMSGGPKVEGINIGHASVDPNAVITLNFDQALATNQAITSVVRVRGGGATVTKQSDTRVAISLAGLARCVPFTIEVLKGVKSKYDIASTTPWSFNSRTICHSLSTIGSSVQGRAINAYTFGSSGPAALYVGALHGNEASSSLILQDWIKELEANYARIPANTRVVVVPTVNPDGLAAGTRNNARNVNLNRNFPTDNWVKDINDTNGKVKGGGGSKPLSEPEAAALARLSTSLRPRLMLSYHAVGSLVVGDPGGYSAGYAAKYASMVGYRNATGQSSDTFDYNITGSYEDWTIQKAGIPSMVIELGSYSYRNFAHHKEAFWAMLR